MPERNALTTKAMKATTPALSVCSHTYSSVALRTRSNTRIAFGPAGFALEHAPQFAPKRPSRGEQKADIDRHQRHAGYEPRAAPNACDSEAADVAHPKQVTEIRPAPGSADVICASQGVDLGAIRCSWTAKAFAPCAKDSSDHGEARDGPARRRAWNRSCSGSFGRRVASARSKPSISMSRNRATTRGGRCRAGRRPPPHSHQGQDHDPRLRSTGETPRLRAASSVGVSNVLRSAQA